MGVAAVLRLLAPGQLPPTTRVVAALPQGVVGGLSAPAPLALTEGALAGLREPARHHLHRGAMHVSAGECQPLTSSGQYPRPDSRAGAAKHACMQRVEDPWPAVRDVMASRRRGVKSGTMSVWSRLWPPWAMAARWPEGYGAPCMTLTPAAACFPSSLRVRRQRSNLGAAVLG